MYKEGTRKQSLGNIYQQQQQSYSTPTTNVKNSNSSSGALDNLMADLMNSMNDDIHLSSPLSIAKPSTSHCASCQEEFDYRDDVKTAGNKVKKKKVLVLPRDYLIYCFTKKCYHKTCFTCRLCSSPFDQRCTHHEYDGKLYCERDFHVVKNRIMCASW
jgi:hypothetical protein